MTVTYQDNQGEHRWTVKAKNGEILGASPEGFSSETEARRNLSRLASAIQIYADSEGD